jgi:hypothetical protein
MLDKQDTFCEFLLILFNQCRTRKRQVFIYITIRVYTSSLQICRQLISLQHDSNDIKSLKAGPYEVAKHPRSLPER